MSIISETTGALGLLGKAWGWLRDRLDPARVQAQRLIQAFEAYGVARQPSWTGRQSIWRFTVPGSTG